MKKNRLLTDEEFIARCHESQLKHIFWVKNVLVDPIQKDEWAVKLFELDMDKFKGDINKLKWAILLPYPYNVTLIIKEVFKDNEGIICVVSLMDKTDIFPKVKKGDRISFVDNIASETTE